MTYAGVSRVGTRALWGRWRDTRTATHTTLCAALPTNVGDRVTAPCARLLSLLLDTPAAPFGVHWMVSGRNVGMWVVPNAAAAHRAALFSPRHDNFSSIGVRERLLMAQTPIVDAERLLPAFDLLIGIQARSRHSANAYELSPTRTHVRTDGTLYQGRCLRLYTHPPPSPLRNRTRERLRGTVRHAGTAHAHMTPKTWMQGDRPTLLLLRIWLLDGINPVYHETIEAHNPRPSLRHVHERAHHPPDDILRAYAAKHASTATATLSPLSGTTAGTEVVPSLRGTGMRVLYKQPEDGVPSAGGNANGGNMIRAGPGARLSR
ncbi:hypothetical protein B0H13DRAFT_2438837 [Mycena leptocephala]|nr:hypothetical protein B0H13DRAFT_2438837 [Mycena leptocephala]